MMNNIESSIVFSILVIYVGYTYITKQPDNTFTN